MKLTTVLIIAVLCSMAFGSNAEALSDTKTIGNNTESVLTDPPRVPRVTYPSAVCPDQHLGVEIILTEMEQDVTYEWFIPTVNESLVEDRGDRLFIADMTDYNDIFPLSILARNSCGVTPLAIPIKKVTALNIPPKNDTIVCTGDPLVVSPLSTTRVASYDWDFGPGEVVFGDPQSGEPFSISFPVEGNHTYTEIITDTDGCVHTQSYNVTTYDAPPSPNISCTDGTPGQVIMDWDEDPSFTYQMCTDLMPTNLTVVNSGPTQVTITGFNSPCQFALLTIKAFGTNPAPCDSTVMTLPCRPSPKPFVVFDHMPDQTAFCIGDEPFPVISLNTVVEGVPNPTTGVWQYQSPPAPQLGLTPIGNSGTFDPNGLAPGVYPLDYVYTNPTDGCTTPTSSTFTIYEEPNPNPSFDAASQVTSAEICADSTIAFFYSIYDDIKNPDVSISPPAPFILEDNGDNSKTIKFSNIEETYNIVVEYNLPDCQPRQETLTVKVNAIPDLNLSCGVEQSDLIEISWDDQGLDSEIFLNGISRGTLASGSTYQITNLQANRDYDIIVETQTLTCGVVRDTIVCSTRECVDPVVTFDNNGIGLTDFTGDTICWNPLLGDFPLGISINAPMGSNGDFTWSNPSLVSQLNLFSGDPLIENYTIVANYEDMSGCRNDIEFSFVYLTEPTPFMAIDPGSDTICFGSTATFRSNYIRPNLTSVIYDLDIPAGANLVSGSNSGPYEFSFDAPGTYEFEMTLSVYGACDGPPETFEIVVEPQRELNLSCGNQAATEIQLVWDDLGLEYEILQGGSPIGTTMDEEYTITGLPTNQTFDFTVRAMDANCGLIEDDVQCITFECIDPEVDFTMIPDTICWDLAANGPFSLNDVTITPAATASLGGFVWDSPLVNANNEFVPTNPLIENYSIDAVYSDDDNCIAIFPLEFIYVESPVVQLSITSEDTICQGNTIALVASYAGQNPDALEYIPSFPPEAMILDNPAPGEYLLLFDEAGEYDLGMTVSYYGCEGPLATEPVVVELAPEANLTCGDFDNTSITLEFDDIGIPYQLSQDGVFVAEVSGPTYQVDGLEMNRTYDFVIEALTPNCGLITDSVTCSTFNCELADIDITAVPSSICHNSEANGPYQLVVTATPVPDPTLGGTIEWDSPYVDANGMFTADPLVEDYVIIGTFVDDNACRTPFTVDFSYKETPRPQLKALSADTICLNGGVVFLESEYTASDMSLVSFTPQIPMGANIVSGRDAGPYEIAFTNTGTYELGMMISNDGCDSESMETVTVEVIASVEAPMVTCTPGFGALTLSWAGQNNVSLYRVFINGELAGNVSFPYETTITGLESLTDYDYIVEPIPNGTALCGAAVATGACTTLACPDVQLVTIDVDTCYDQSLEPFAIPVQVTTSGLIPDGVGGWTGPLIDVNDLVDVSGANRANTYELTYTFTEAGCETSIVSLVTFHDPPTVAVESERPGCPDEDLGTVIVSVMGGEPDFSYALNGGQFQADNVFSEVPVGNYEVNVVDGYGCNVVASDFLEANDEDPSIDISGPNVIVEDNNADFELIIADLDQDTVTNISWYLDGTLICDGLDCTTITLENVIEPGTLTVDFVYGDGCMLDAAIDFDVREVNAVYIPNMVDYSGNAGPPNNEWKAFVKGSQSFITTVQIFDRWGNLVKDYENKSMDNIKEFLIWNGFIGSVQADQGVYTYVIGLLIEDEPEIKYGTVTILR